MSAAAQVSAFCRDIVKSKEIWTIQFDDNSFIKWENHDGSQVFPIWSTESRVKRVLKFGEEFEGGEAVSFGFQEFLKSWLPRLTKEGVGLGPNWAGENLSGWSFEAQELIARVKSTPGFSE
ncbi:MAG: DUF2750 domain-containing protein [Sedimenticola sp.]